MELEGAACNLPPIPEETSTGAAPKKFPLSGHDGLPLHTFQMDSEVHRFSERVHSNAASKNNQTAQIQHKNFGTSEEELVNLIHQIVNCTLQNEKMKTSARDKNHLDVESCSTSEVSKNLLEFAKLVPIFDEKGNIHPVDYITQIEQLLSLLQVPFKPYVLIDKFRGRSRSWANVFLLNFSDFSLFKNAFLEQFWGHPQQLKFKLALESAKYNEYSGSLVEHFLKYVEMGRHLQPPYTETILITTIARHYPPHVSSCLIGAQNITDALERLRQADYYYRTTHIDRQAIPSDTSRNQPQGRHPKFQQKTVTTINSADFAPPNTSSVENDEGNEGMLAM